jgi:phosphoglycolate phosphatase
MSFKEAEQAVRKYRERYSTVGIFENKLYKGIDTVLAKLKEEGFLLAVATSKPEEYTKRILEHFAVEGYFDEVVGSTMDGKRNKKADIIREVFRRMQISEESKPEVIMVGDRKHDILGAKDCGIASLGVTWGFGSEQELKEYQADYIVYQVEELLDFFHTK